VTAWRRASARSASIADSRRKMPATGTGSPASASACITQVLQVKPSV